MGISSVARPRPRKRAVRAVLALLSAFALHLLCHQPAQAGKVLVSYGGSIARFDPVTGNFVDWLVPPGTSGVEAIWDLIVGPDGHLYASDWMGDSVLRFDSHTGTLVDTFVPPGSGGLDTPKGLAFGPDGHLYVCSSGNRVLRYDGATGAFMGIFVPAGSGGLASPSHLAFAPDGHLYVASKGTDQVLRYNGSTGASMGILVAAGSGGLNEPERLLFSGPGLAVAGGFPHQVLFYHSTTGAFHSQLVAPGGGLSEPRGMAWSPDGRIHVASTGSHQVMRLIPGSTTAEPFITLDTGGKSNPQSVLFLPPRAPSSLVARLVAPSQVYLNWIDNSDDEVEFRVWRREGAGEWTKIGTTRAHATGFVDTNVSPTAGDYSYRVQAFSWAGLSLWSNVSLALPPSSLPEVPQEVTASLFAPGQIYVSWTSSDPRVTGYSLWRKAGPGDWALMTVLPASMTHYRDTSLLPDTLYTYRLRALGNAGTSDWSSEAAVLTASVPPWPPTALMATPVSSTQINLSWFVQSSSETAVVIWRKVGSGAFTRLVVLPPGANSYSDTGLTAGTTYSYQVRTTNNFYASPWSNTATATTP